MAASRVVNVEVVSDTVCVSDRHCCLLMMG
jgi:hypothetical protein